MEVKVLGSVSPFPKNNSNGPGFLVTSGQNKILLDCGPGSTSLLDMEQDLPNLTVILSHLHRDHYSDLISSIAYASYVYHNLGLLKNKIKVFLPDLDKEESQTILDFQLLTNLGTECYLEFITYHSTSQLTIGDITVTFSSNPHSIKSHSIKLDNGVESLVYSGDTGYNHNTLTSFAKNCNLLICEATFLRGQLKGRNDYHLYAHEAAEIALISNPNQLMLTHFWPTIDKELYVNEALHIFPNTIAAEEGKVLKLTK